MEGEKLGSTVELSDNARIKQFQEDNSMYKFLARLIFTGSLSALALTAQAEGAQSVQQLLTQADCDAKASVLQNLVASGVALSDAVTAVISSDPEATSCIVGEALRMTTSIEERDAVVTAAVQAASPQHTSDAVQGAIAAMPKDQAAAIAAVATKAVPSDASVITAAAIVQAPNQADAIIVAVTDVVIALGGGGGEIDVTQREDGTVEVTTDPENTIIVRPIPYSVRTASPF